MTVTLLNERAVMVIIKTVMIPIMLIIRTLMIIMVIK